MSASPQSMKTATGLVLWWMRLWGYYGWTSSWGTLYALAGYEDNLILRRHEECHLMQMRRDGWLVFHVKTLWYLVRYGYTNSPYEIEARAAEGL